MSLETSKKYILALTGRRGTGKSTAAQYLVEKYGFKEMSFADPLKKICSIALDTPIVWFTDPKLKEKVIPHWGNTPRYFMQKWGTEVFRETIPNITPEIKSLWIQLMDKKINESESPLIVISDCRFIDESIFLDKTNHIKHLICIEGHTRSYSNVSGPSSEHDSICVYSEVSTHPSEQGLPKDIINHTWKNDSSIEAFYSLIDKTISDEDYPIKQHKEVNPRVPLTCDPERIMRFTVPPDTDKLFINNIDHTTLINPDYRVESSAMIGKNGEDYIIDVLKGAYPEVTIENISSKARAGDILFKPNLQTVGHQAQIMFEVKKYSAKVPTAQYEKFLRDIRESNHDAGVFISLTSAITGVTDSIVIDTIITERDGTTVPVIIAATNDKNIIQSLTALIIGYVTLLRKKGAFVQQSDFTVRLIGSLQSSLNAYNGIRSKVHELRSTSEKMLDGIQESLATNYTEIRVLLNQLQGLIEVEEELETEKLKDSECPYEYPKAINQFLLLLKETGSDYEIDFQSDKKIIITPNGTWSLQPMELTVLKTKITCEVGQFYSNSAILSAIHIICQKLCEHEETDAMFPFDSYTINKKRIKFDLVPKVYDVAIGFLTRD